MEDIKIPHAEKAYVDRSLSPREFLHVVTKLPEHSPSGADADARHEMLKAIAADKGLAAAHSEADRIGAANANDARYLATLGLFFAGREDYATARVWLARALVKLRAKKAGTSGDKEGKDAKDQSANAITDQDAVAQRVGELGLLKTMGLVDVRLG